MIAVGIICEYNPFHLGHRIQLDAVKQRFGDDTCVIALMSGSYVQRGGPAVLPKEERAAVALSEGANLVLELPFPWCMSGADRFAAGAIAILEGLGAVDYLAFGSESAQIERLSKIAAVIASSAFEKALGEQAARHPHLSFAALREAAYQEVAHEPLPRLDPNDLLGVAYLSHLKTIQPLPLHRLPGYSATKARTALSARDWSVLSTQVPPSTIEALQRTESLPQEWVDAAVLSHLLLTPAEELAQSAECNRELAARLKSAAEISKTVTEVVERATSKHYTSARVRRALWHSYLKTPGEMPMGLPHYTSLLAADEKGRAFLRVASKKGEIAIVTRPSNASSDPQIAAEFAFSQCRDQVYQRFCGKIAEKKPPLMK